MTAVSLALYIPNIEYFRQEKEISSFNKKMKDIKADYHKRGIYSLMRENSDCVGFLSIKGTNISYPVMQTKDEPEFYLNHDFKKEYSYYGLPFLDYRCDLDSSNLLIYGHNITGKRYFGYLTNYLSYDFCKQHKTINLNTKFGEAVYEIVAVINTDTSFPWYKFINIQNLTLKEQEKWLNCVLENSVYNCACKKETDITENMQFLTLSTCADTGGEKRLLVIALKNTKSK